MLQVDPRVDGRATRSVPRRIALFTGNYVNVVDGGSLIIHRLIGDLQAHGHEVVVFAPDGRCQALQPTAEFVRLPAVPAPLQPEYRLALRITRAARDRLRSLKPDLIHIATPDLVGLAAQRYGRARGIPVVTSFLSNIVAYLQYVPLVRYLQPVGWAYFRYFYGRCRHIYVPTASMAEELRAHGIAAGVRIWEWGIDLDRFTPAKRSLAFRRAHGVADDECLILFVGRLRWEKGLALMADVFSRLESRKIRHRTMIVGAGAGDASLRKRLPNTIFTGHLEGETLASAYASADLFFFPSAVETFGCVTLEAMASGLPCLCANAPGSRTLALDGEAAMLARRDDADDFFTKAVALVEDSAARQRLGARALQRARDFSWSAANDRLMAYHEDAIAGLR